MSACSALADAACRASRGRSVAAHTAVRRAAQSVSTPACRRAWAPQRAPAASASARHAAGGGGSSAATSTVTAPLAPAQQPPPPLHIAPSPAVPYERWLPPEALLCCEPSAAPLRVAMLLSGGVDSSLALNLAVASGHRVTAFYLQIWFEEDFRNFWDACPWEEDLAYARAVCDQARVPLKVVPLTKEYWERVVSTCVSEIAAGRTPNPDVLCNSRVKFGAFLEHLQAAHSGSFDRVASGHYARLERHGDHALPPMLRLCGDAVKDQTYFLAALSQAQLRHAMFPLGALDKAQVRALAVAGALPPAGRKDSQGICFLGKVKFSEFVAQHLGEAPGSFVEMESGQRVGTHRGVWFYTIGQRQGIKLSGGPWYVAAKDAERNLVYISKTYHSADKQRNTFRCGSFSWLGDARAGQGPEAGMRVKVRHGPEFYRAALRWETPEQVAAAREGGRHRLEALYNRVTPVRHDPQPRPTQPQPQELSGTGEGLTARVVLDGSDQGLAAGQYAVFYDRHGHCLGCAVILGQEGWSSEETAAL